LATRITPNPNDTMAPIKMAETIARTSKSKGSTPEKTPISVTNEAVNMAAIIPRGR
jgi:hypothetical protein